MPRLTAGNSQDVVLTDPVFLICWEWYGGVDDAGGYPANLRLFPSLNHFDSTAIRARVNDFGLWPQFADQLEGGVDAAAAWAEEIFEGGM
jgi:hypothetical protein